jgi:hypothetical protein
MLRSVLSALLVLLAPGFSAYDAAAQVVRAPVAPVTGSIRLNVGAPTASLGSSLLSAPSLSLAAAPSSLPAAPAAAAPALAAALPAAAPLPALLAARALPRIRSTAAASAAVSARPASSEFRGDRDARAFDQADFRASVSLPVFAAAADGPEEAPRDSGLKPASEAAAAPAPKKIPRPLWGFFWGHDIATVLGINFHMLSQPFLVQSTLGMGTATMGFVRNIHMGAMAIVNFLPIGYLIDKTDFRVVAISTAVARALLMGAIPLLWSAGLLHFGVLAAIVAFNPLFQSTMIVAEGAAMKTLLGKDEKLNKDATATFSKWDAVAGMAMPLVAGWVVGALVSGFGLGGYAMAYGVYAGLLLVSIPIYWFTIKDPRFPGKMSPVEAVVQGATFLGALLASMVHPLVAILRWAFASFFPGARSAFPTPYGGKGLVERVKRLGVAALWTAREALVALAGAVLLLPALVKALKFLPGAWRAARTGGSTSGLADLLDRYKPMEGLAYILRNKTLRILTAVMALEVLLVDALPFVILPNLIQEGLGKVPAIMPAAFASAGGLMGLLFSIEYLGRFIPSMRLEGSKGDAIIEKVGHGAFYKRAAFASLLFWALLAPLYLTTGLFWVNLAIVGGVMFGVQYFNTPVGIVLAPVKRAEMDDAKLARIESAVFMVDVAFESVGALLLGLLMDFAGLKAALIVTALFISLTGILQYKVPSWIFPDGNRPAKKAP